MAAVDPKHALVDVTAHRGAAEAQPRGDDPVESYPQAGGNLDIDACTVSQGLGWGAAHGEDPWGSVEVALGSPVGEAAGEGHVVALVGLEIGQGGGGYPAMDRALVAGAAAVALEQEPDVESPAIGVDPEAVGGGEGQFLGIRAETPHAGRLRV